MIKGQNSIRRYSEAFKQQVVSEIENGHLTQAEAARKYDICHRRLVHYWVKRSGKTHLLRKVVRIEMPDEIKPQDIIKQLKAEKQQLESALAQSHLKNELLETMIDLAEEHYGIDIKKNSGLKQPGVTKNKKKK